MTISQMLITALVGMLVVFAVLVLLMFAIKVMAAIFSKADNTSANSNTDSDKTVSKAAAQNQYGGLKLTNVSDKDAALIMAIVADELKTPLNELRFISINLEDQN